MFLKYINIKHFRGIHNLSIDLNHTTIFIGENNTGKTAILDAIQIALGGIRDKNRRTVSEYDHHLTNSKNRAEESEPIEIILRFTEQENKKWPDSTIQKIGDVIQTDMNGHHSMTVHVQGKYNVEEGRSDLEWSFVTLSDTPQQITSVRAKSILREVVQPFALYSIRDSNQEFKPNAKFWGTFIRSVKMDEKQSKQFEKELSVLNQKIMGAQESFSEVKKQLSEIAKLIHFDRKNPVSIEALPSKISEILSRAQVSLTSPTGASIPVEHHGQGTQSLAVMCLLMTYLQTKIESNIEWPSFVLTIEEPEAHLHPSASSSIINILDNMHHGQSVVATHSGDLISTADVSSLRRLRRVNGKITCYKINTTLDDSEKRIVEHQIKAARGNLLFARCWLLVEGESDYIILDACASACKIDLMYEGVYCIEYAQSAGTVVTWIKIARQFGIEWVLVTDGDEKGKENISNVKEYLEKDNISDSYIDLRTHKLNHVLEVFLCMNGYSKFYNPSSPVECNDASYWEAEVKKIKSKKVSKAIEVANEINRVGSSGVPAKLQRIIYTSVDLARKAQ